MALTLTNDILKFRESTSDPWEKLLVQANMNFNLIYPVGSIYMSTVNVDPGTIFGGTWEQLKDAFLLGAGDNYTAGDTGGEAEHTLTDAELPATSGSFRTRRMSWGTGSQSSAANVWSPSGKVSITPTGTSGTDSVAYYTGVTRGYETVEFNFGSDTPHNNMPPYLVVYMWRRLTLSPTIYTPPASVLIGDVASQDIVPVSMGGTGADNAADAIANLGFESDTNYCKMPDGTLICWGSATFPDASVGVQNVTVQYPVSFESVPFVTVCWNDNPTSTKNYMGMLVVNKSSSTKSQLVIGTDRLRTGYVWYVSYIAIGRWK